MLGYFESIFAGKLKVRYHDVRLFPDQEFDRASCVIGHQASIPKLLEVPGTRNGQIHLIVRYQNAW
jgi:hypothetical protein